MNALSQKLTDNRGVPIAGIDTTVRTITNDTNVTNHVDLCSVLIPTYIAALPEDPQTNNGAAVTNCTSLYNSNYTVVQSATDGRFTISAPAAQLGETIEVTR